MDGTPPEKQQAIRLGWAEIEPIEVSVPRSEPVTNADVRRADPAEPILVNVWASWCPPCEDELPLLEEVSASGALQVVGLTRDIRRGNAVKSLEEAGVEYENWMDPGAEFVVALDGRIPMAAVPASALIVDGRVVAVHIGEFEGRAEVLAGLTLLSQGPE